MNNPTIWEYDLWGEYDSAAEWCAKHGHSGAPGTLLPKNLSLMCLNEINFDTDAFHRRVKECQYALAMEKTINKGTGGMAT